MSDYLSSVILDQRLEALQSFVHQRECTSSIDDPLEGLPDLAVFRGNGVIHEGMLNMNAKSHNPLHCITSL